MKFWVSAVLWNDFLVAGQDQKELLGVAEKFGLSGFEVRPFWKENPLTEAREMAALASAKGLELSYACNEAILTESLEKNQETFKGILKSIEIAKAMNSKVLRVNIDPQADWALLESEEWQAGAAEVLAVAEAEGICLALENPPNGRVGTIEAIGRLLNQLPKLQLTFDTGNWVIAGNHPSDAVQAFAGRIGYLHLKDIRILGGGAYGHCQPGLGGIDFHPLLKELGEAGYQGPKVLEFLAGQEPEARIQAALDYLEK